jgi:pseudaminic acid cytidylyltransferase
MKLLIIPARGGSKRIKKKNIVTFLGRPIISYALEAARESELFDKIHVSTDSEEIKLVVETLGYAVDFMRPENLSDDMTGLLPVLEWVLKEYQTRGLAFEDIGCLMPAAPMLDAEDLKAGYQLYEKAKKKHPLMVVAPFPVPIEWAYYRNEKGLLTPLDLPSLEKRSQDITNTYYESGPFYFFHRSHILGDIPLQSRKYISYLIAREKAVDIDTLEDLQFAEALFRGKYQKRVL